MLRPDGLPRGQFALHFRKHHKLGRHRTIIKGAVPYIQAAIALPEVWRIDLGKIDRRSVRSRLGVQLKTDRARISLVVVDDYRRQRFLICARAVELAPEIVSTLLALNV